MTACPRLLGAGNIDITDTHRSTACTDSIEQGL